MYKLCNYSLWGLIIAFLVLSCNKGQDFREEGTAIQITPPSPLSYYFPRWSPDGRYIACLAAKNDSIGSEELRIIDFSSGKPVRVIKMDRIVTAYPSWSPDGQEIVLSGGTFRGDSTAMEGIYRLSLTGEGVPEKIFEGRYSLAPDLSPDGGKIVFTRSKRYNFRECNPIDSHIWIINLDGKGLKQLTFGENIDFFPRWSPDGKRIAFVRAFKKAMKEEKEALSIMLMKADGIDISKWYEGVASSSLSWSPDGKRIIFNKGSSLWILPSGPGAKPSRLKIHKWVIIEKPGGKRVHRPFLKGLTGCSCPDWSSDGKRIVFVGEKMDSKGDVFNDLYAIEVPDSLR